MEFLFNDFLFIVSNHLDDNYKILHNQRPTDGQQKIKIVESLPLEEKTLKFDGDKKINFSISTPKLKLCSLTVHNGRCNNCDMFEANAKKHFETAIKKKRQFDDTHLNADDDDDDDGWTDQGEEDESCSDVTTASSRGSTPTPRSSPKRSPLLSKKVLCSLSVVGVTFFTRNLFLG